VKIFNVKNNYFIVLILCLLCPVLSFAQTGGTQAYGIMKISLSPRLVAMGVTSTSIYDDDIELVATNPSLINANMHNDLSLAFVDYFADAKYGRVSYSRTFEKAGSFAASLIYASSPNMQYVNAGGEKLESTFSANEYVAVIGWGRSLTPNWSIGANLKMIGASYEQYGSFGLAVDVAGTYRIEEKRLDMSLIVRNLGLELSKPGIERNRMPFEVQYVLSHQLKHLPFRFTVLVHDMQRWNLRYDDPTLDRMNKSKFYYFTDNFMRHISIGGEFTIAKIVFLRLGYDYNTANDMKTAGIRGMNGFSLGVGLDIYRFEINYAHAFHTLGNGENHISIKTSLSDWIK